MARQALHIGAFLEKAALWPVIDVRSPGEFQAGHIPGAVNIPLFDDEERRIIGTLYKQEGSKPAFLKGLDVIGPKMRPIIRQAEKLSDGRPLLVHCWRGGMRSGSVAQLLNMYGLEAHTLQSGYKAFRNWALEQFGSKKNITILGGMTGSGKTAVLLELQKLGEQVIDLEGLAGHKGSAFGSLGMPEPPTQEQFENELAVQWAALDAARPVWLEDENRTIGRKVIPEGIWQQMLEAPAVLMEIPLKQRIENLLADYGGDMEGVRQSVQRIKKRLGGLAYKHALQALDEGDGPTVAVLCLKYYDKSYHHHLDQRPHELLHPFEPEGLAPGAIARELLEFHRNKASI